MKKTILLLMFVLTLSYCSAQERIQKVSEGINLLGRPKDVGDEYISSKGFKLASKYKGVYNYEKDSNIGKYEIVFNYRNNKMNVISWGEHLIYLQTLLSELKISGFENNLSNAATGIFSFKNIERNLIISLIPKNDVNEVFITIGFIDPNLSISSSKITVSNRVNSFFKGTKFYRSNDDAPSLYKVTIHNNSFSILEKDTIVGSSKFEFAPIKGTIKNGRIYTSFNEKIVRDYYIVNKDFLFILQPGLGSKKYITCAVQKGVTSF